MKKLILLCFILSFLVASTYAQEDTNGIPDIFLPNHTDIYKHNDRTDPIKTIFINLLFNQPVLIVYSSSGNGNPPDGPVEPPPPAGLWMSPSSPTKNGCDYWKISGKLPDGTPYEITSQTYFPQGTHPEDKCNKIKNTLNGASDNHTSGQDPIDATVNGEDGRVEVKPNEGCTVESSEFTNGSGETDNETGEMSEQEEVPSTEGKSAQQNKMYRLFAARITGKPCGFDSNSQQSHISFGVGPYKLMTYVASDDTPLKILQRFKKSLILLGFNAKLGIDTSNGDWLLLWKNPYSSAPFGTNDYGLSNSILMTRTSVPLVGGNQVWFGAIMVNIVVVDPDEAMPMY